MVRYEQSFWAFATDIWFELLGTDYYAYVRVHGVTANARHQLIAVAYLFCGFQELGCLGRLASPALARKIFGTEAFDAVIDEMNADLLTWGYSRQGNIVGLRCALAEAMLASRSLCLSDLKAETLDRLYQEADAKITRRGLTILSYVLVRRGLLKKPLGRDGQIERRESIAHRRVLNGVPAVWRESCERWFATTTLQHSSCIGVLYRLFNAGRWLAQSGYGSEPADWTREIAAAYVAAVDRSTIGQWSTGVATPASRTGQPLKPASKASALTAMRQFFRDCQEWGWILVRFNPFQALATPRSVRCLIGPDPRIIQDDVWAKLLWAGLNLTDQELSKPNDPEARGDGHFYPATMVKALVLVWLFSGLRRNEIARLRVGCIRWQSGEEKVNEQPVCFLHVPVNKTGTAFSKPVDGVVGRAVELWEHMRPPSPPLLTSRPASRCIGSSRTADEGCRPTTSTMWSSPCSAGKQPCRWRMLAGASPATGPEPRLPPSSTTRKSRSACSSCRSGLGTVLPNRPGTTPRSRQRNWPSHTRTPATSLGTSGPSRS